MFQNHVDYGKSTFIRKSQGRLSPDGTSGVSKGIKSRRRDSAAIVAGQYFGDLRLDWSSTFALIPGSLNIARIAQCKRRR